LVPPPIQSAPTRRFRFLSCLGWGGFGEVYLAEMATSSGFEKKVAVKVLKADLADNDKVAKRLRDEGRLLGLLQHPAIVRADDLVQLAGQPAVVMEYVPGANLSALIERRFCPTLLPISVALHIVRRVASALDAAFHSSSATGEPLRVLHRDIKPSNIRITPHGEVKILDFGIARSSHHAREAITKDYQLGSMPYMAPEVMGGGKASSASDVYSLGVVFFELATRSRLGWASEARGAHVVQIETAMERLDLDSCDEDERKEIHELLAQMLDFDPDSRPSAPEVERRCRGLERRIRGPSLEEWARVAFSSLRMPELPNNAPLVGKELTEELTATTFSGSELANGANVRRPLVPGGAESERTVITGSHRADASPWGRLGRRLSFGLGLLVSVGVAGWLLLRLQGGGPAPHVAPPPVPAAETPDVAPAAEEAETVSEQRAIDEVELAPAPRAEESEAVPASSPPRRDELERPLPAEPSGDPERENAEQPASPPIEIRIGSHPFGLRVFLDDRALGETPRVVEVPPGPHVLRFEDGEHHFEASIQVGSDEENRWIYDRAKDELR
jgi:serine/threonine protein kinase